MKRRLSSLDNPTTSTYIDADTIMAVQDEIEKESPDFCRREITVSGRNVVCLARLAIAIAAEFGLILHLGTKDVGYGQLFDENYATMKLLAAKGIDSDLTYRMKWHWRAETDPDHKSRGARPFDSLHGKICATFTIDFSSL